jgi:phosphatidylserine/phosphatidylglycerophosphate/cardiolipin synthase-like enzyme
MVLDTSQMGQAKEIEQLVRLKAAGVPMKRDTHSGIMHMKVLVADSREFLTGSFNFTNNATLNNNENVFAWDCPRNAVLYQAEFNRIWTSFKDAVIASPDAGP